MADSHLLAMVLFYFKRAGFVAEEFSVSNFWLALYLAHDQEEEDDRTKWNLLPWALGPDWQASFCSWMVKKDQLWRRMGHRSLVSRRQCDQVMAVSASLPIWSRRRDTSYGGAMGEPSGDPRGTSHGVTGVRL